MSNHCNPQTLRWSASNLLNHELHCCCCSNISVSSPWARCYTKGLKTLHWAPLPVCLLIIMSHPCACDKISQAFPLHFKYSKTELWWSPRNKATNCLCVANIFIKCSSDYKSSQLEVSTYPPAIVYLLHMFTKLYSQFEVILSWKTKFQVGSVLEYCHYTNWRLDPTFWKKFNSEFSLIQLCNSHCTIYFSVSKTKQQNHWQREAV